MQVTSGNLVAVSVDQDSDRETLEWLSELEAEARQRGAASHSDNSAWMLSMAEAVMRSDTEVGADIRIELLLLAVQCCYSDGKVEDGLPVAKRALQLAELSRSPSARRRCLNLLGVTYLGLRDLTNATVCLVNGLKLAEQLGDRTAKCGVLANLATVRLEAGLIDESVKLNRYLIQLTANEVILRPVALQAHFNICLAALTLADVDLAVRHMQLVQQLLPPPDTQWLVRERAAIELTFTRVCLEANDVPRAREHAALAERVAATTTSRTAKIEAELAGALCDAAEGAADHALLRIERVEAVALPNEPVRRDILIAKERCYRETEADRYARYYEQRHLADLSRFQRQTANQQIAAIKHSIPERPERGSARNDEIFSKLESLAILAELREDGSGDHAFRVGRIASMVALAIGRTDVEAEMLEVASRLHDIGKIAIPDAIVMKRAGLSDAEREIVRRHTTEGCQMIADLMSAAESRLALQDISILRTASEIALNHHERWDGSGYPRKLAGHKIPECARITALADAFDKLTRNRPYKPAVSTQQALRIMGLEAGAQFDPDLFCAFSAIAETLTTDGMGVLRFQMDEPPFFYANRVIDQIVRSVTEAS